MSDFGVTPAGFVRKSLPETLADIEAKNREVFGVNVIQTPESPIGVLNGVIAELVTTLWESLDEVYQSNDPSQAENVNLDRLATIRRMSRIPGESDEDYRARIINTGRERSTFSELENAVAALPGVSYVRVFTNETGVTDRFGLPPFNLAVAVAGGENEAIGEAIYRYTTEGLPTWGNTIAEITDDEGFARSVFFTRPNVKPLYVDLFITRSKALRPEPVPPFATIKAMIVEALSGILNGDTVTPARITSSVRIPGAEIVSARIGRVGDRPTDRTIAFNFDELPVVSADTVNISWVD